MKHFAYWLFLIFGIAMFAVYGTQYSIDIANLGALKIELRSATQSAATYAFHELSLEGVAERYALADREHRIVILDKYLAKQRFEKALKDNLGLNNSWEVVESKYLTVGSKVDLIDLQIIDSTDVPYDNQGVTYTEPTVFLEFKIPISSYLYTNEYIEVTRTIPFRTFITNRQTN